MKKMTALVLCCMLALSSVGCMRQSGSGDTGNKRMTIMVNDMKYYSTYEAVSVEVDDSAIQYTTSYAAGDGVPRKNGEANFDYGTPYAVLEDDVVVVLIDGEWIEFSSKLRPQ